MKPVFVEGTTLDDVWFQLLSKIHEHGRKYKIDAGSYAGDIRLEFDFVSGFIHNPHVRPLAPIMPEGSSLPAPTSDESGNLYFANYIMDANLAPNEEYRYSTWINGQILPYPEYCREVKCEFLSNTVSGDYCVQQLNSNRQNEYKLIAPNFTCPIIEDRPNTPVSWVINHFKNCGYGNNHCYIPVGNPHSTLAYDRPFTNELERGTSPCLRGLDFKIKDGKLITSIVFRSWDLFAGFPENMIGFILLNEYIADNLPGVEPGPIAFSCAGLHCYGFQLEILKARLGKD